LRRAAEHLREGRIELGQRTAAGQQNGRGVVEDGLLLIQQGVEAALAPGQFLAFAHALGDVLVQADEADAAPSSSMTGDSEAWSW
jgi:hypothetical protein